MSFDYPYTCPDIDKAIDDCKDKLRQQIEILISDACPFMKSMSVDEKAREYSQYFWEAVEEAFEGARESNKFIRKAAEHQITALEDEVDNLQDQVQQLERQIEA